MAEWNTEKVLVQCNGDTYEADESEEFGPTIKNFARKHGWSRFRVFVDNKELETPSAAPKTFSGISEVRLSKYDEAGQ